MTATHFNAQNVVKKTPRTMSDIMGEKERHKKTCSGFIPGTRNFWYKNGKSHRWTPVIKEPDFDPTWFK